ncbi:MAG: hypothetical protein JNL22_09580 [Bacteroidales bacterium]|jgi:asparagine synthase (glutamine-hydrolysing)|nr:hypothetical protein [Bacteroidales bacterium]
MIVSTLTNPLWSKYRKDTVEISFIGYLYYDNILVLTAEDLMNIFIKKQVHTSIDSEYLSTQFLVCCKGNFSFVIESNYFHFVASDIIRNYPLFLYTGRNIVMLSDHIGAFPNDYELNLEAIDEFFHTGMVLGNKTVYKKIRAIQAGELLTVNNKIITSVRYFKFLYDVKIVNSKSDKQLAEELNCILESIIERMVSSCSGVHNWVVPLSGGHDSRLILNYLFKLGVPNVICFSYGTPNNIQSEISKKVAQALSYKWFFVEYNDDAWKELHQNGLFDKYIHYSFNGISTPHVQDLLAIYTLKKNGIISEKDIVVPGHTGLTEATVSRLLQINNKRDAISFIYGKYAKLWQNSTNETKIQMQISTLLEENQIHYALFPEFFNWQERQAKFINNSIRAYEFLNIGWRLPFWEQDLVDFWQSIDFNRRNERKFLFYAAKHFLFVEHLRNVPISNKFDKPKHRRNYLRLLIPMSVISFVNFLIKRRAVIAEGTNSILSVKSETIKEIVGPLEAFPKSLRRIIKPYLSRRPYQIDINSLIILYTLSREVFNTSNTKNKADK